MAVHLHSLTFDCADPPGLARFWSALTGYSVSEANERYAALAGDGSVGPRFLFLKVTEGKAAKNRVHLDLGTADLDAEVDRIQGLGAALVHRRQEHGLAWATFTDPEGNEFCVGLHDPAG